MFKRLPAAQRSRIAKLQAVLNPVGRKMMVLKRSPAAQRSKLVEVPTLPRPAVRATVDLRTLPAAQRSKPVKEMLTLVVGPPSRATKSSKRVPRTAPGLANRAAVLPVTGQLQLAPPNLVALNPETFPKLKIGMIHAVALATLRLTNSRPSVDPAHLTVVKRLNLLNPFLGLLSALDRTLRRVFRLFTMFLFPSKG